MSKPTAKELAKELPQLPKTVNVVIVDPALMTEVLRLLQEELPMQKVRAVVQALESCSIAQVPAPAEK